MQWQTRIEQDLNHQLFGHWTTTVLALLICFLFFFFPNITSFRCYFKASVGFDVSTHFHTSTQIVSKNGIQKPNQQNFSVNNKACKYEEVSSYLDPGAQRRHQSKVLWLRSWSLFTLICRPHAPTLPRKSASCEISLKEPTAVCLKKTDWLLITHTQLWFKPPPLPCVNRVTGCLSAEQFDPSGPVSLFCNRVQLRCGKDIISRTQWSGCCITPNIDCKRALSHSIALMGRRGAAGKHQRHLSLLRRPLFFQGITHKRACLTCSYVAAPPTHTQQTPKTLPLSTQSGPHCQFSQTLIKTCKVLPRPRKAHNHMLLITAKRFLLIGSVSGEKKKKFCKWVTEMMSKL